MKKVLNKIEKDKTKKCKLYQIRLKCQGCGKIYCRSVPLYSCLECGGMLLGEG